MKTDSKKRIFRGEKMCLLRKVLQNVIKINKNVLKNKYYL